MKAPLTVGSYPRHDPGSKIAQNRIQEWPISCYRGQKTPVLYPYTDHNEVMTTMAADDANRSSRAAAPFCRRRDAGRESRRPVHRRGRARAARPFPVEHTLARLGAERLWELLESDAPVGALGALTGGQAVQMVRAGLAGDLPLRLAGRGRREPRRPDLSRPEPLSGKQRPGARQADEQRAAARRPDRRGRGPRRALLARADRRRRRGRLRRRR